MDPDLIGWLGGADRPVRSVVISGSEREGWGVELRSGGWLVAGASSHAFSEPVPLGLLVWLALAKAGAFRGDRGSERNPDVGTQPCG